MLCVLEQNSIVLLLNNLMFLNKLIQLSEWLIDLLTHKDSNLIQSGNNFCINQFGWVNDQMTPANKVTVSILNESVFSNKSDLVEWVSDWLTHQDNNFFLE